MVALSTDTRERAQEMADATGAEFPVLADPDAVAARSYGVFDLLGDGVATPATFIIRSDGTLAWFRVALDIADRATPPQILAALDQL